MSTLWSRLTEQEESLTISTVILTGARVVGWLPTLAVPILLVRLLSQEMFGVYKQLFLVLGTATPLLILGLAASLFYFVPRDERGGQAYVLNALGVTFVMGAVGAWVLLQSQTSITDLLALDVPGVHYYLALLAGLLFVSVPSETVAILPVVDKRPSLAGLLFAGYDAIRGLAVVAAALVWRSLEAVIWAALAVAVLRLAILLAYVFVLRPHPSVRPGKDLGRQLGYSMPIAASSALAIGLESFHSYFVASQVSAEMFAIYAVGVINIPFIGLLKRSIVEVVLVRFTEAYGRGELSEVVRTWYVALSRLAVLFFPLWLLGEIFAHDLIVTVFGVDYSSATNIFRVFLFTLPLSVLIDGSVLRATNDTGFLMAATGVGLVVSILSILVLPGDPMLGAITSYVLGLTAVRVVSLIKVRTRLELAVSELLPWRELGKTLAAVFLAGVSTLPVFWLTSGSVPRILIGTVVFTATYLYAGWRLNLLPRQELRWIARRFAPGLWERASGDRVQ